MVVVIIIVMMVDMYFFPTSSLTINFSPCAQYSVDHILERIICADRNKGYISLFMFFVCLGATSGGTQDSC